MVVISINKGGSKRKASAAVVSAGSLKRSSTSPAGVNPMGIASAAAPVDAQRQCTSKAAAGSSESMRQEITGAAGGSRAVKTKIIRTHMLQEAAGKQEQRRKEIEAKRLQQTEVENNRRKKPKEVKHLEYTRARKQERARKNMSEDDKKKLLKYVAEVSVERPVLSVDEVVMAEGPQIVGWSKEKMSEALAKMYIKRFLQEVKDHQHKSAAEIREGFKQVTDLWELRAEANDASIDTRGKKRPWLTLHGYRIDLESAANAELLERLRNDEGIEFIDPGRGPSAFRFSFRPALGICDRVALRRVIDHAVYQGISHAELLPTKVQELNYMNKDADGAEYERHNTYPGVMRDLDVLLGVRVVRVFSRTTSDGKLIQLCDRCNAQLCHRCILKVQKELRAMLGLAEPNEGGGGAEGCQLQYQFPSHEPGDYFRLQARRGRGVPKAALIDAVNRAGKCVELPNGRWTWPPTEYGPHHVATCVCVEARRAALSAARCVSMARAYQTARNRVQKNMSLPVWHADYDDSPPRALLLTVGGICDKTIMSAFPPTEPGATESEQWFKALWMDQIVPRGDALQKELLKSQRRLEVDYAVRRMRREELRRRMAQAAQKPRKQIEKAFRKVTNSHLHASIFGDRAPKTKPA